MIRLFVVACLLIGSPALAQQQQPQSMTSAQIVAQQIGQLVIQNAQFQERITQLEAEVTMLKKAHEFKPPEKKE